MVYDGLLAYIFWAVDHLYRGVLDIIVNTMERWDVDIVEDRVWRR